MSIAFLLEYEPGSILHEFISAVAYSSAPMIKAYMRIGRFEVQDDEDLLAQIPAVLEKACTVFSEQHRGSPEACSFLDLANTTFVHAVSFFLFVMLAALPLQHIHLIMRIVIHHVSPYNEDRI